MLVLIILMGLFCNTSHVISNTLLSRSKQSATLHTDQNDGEDALYNIATREAPSVAAAEEGDWDRIDIDWNYDFFEISSISSFANDCDCDGDDNIHDDRDDDSDVHDDYDDDDEHEYDDDNYDDPWHNDDDDNDLDGDDHDGDDDIADDAAEVFDGIEHHYDHHDDSDDGDSVMNWREYLRQNYGDEHADAYDSEMSSLHFDIDAMDSLDDSVWASWWHWENRCVNGHGVVVDLIASVSCDWLLRRPSQTCEIIFLLVTFPSPSRSCSLFIVSILKP